MESILGYLDKIEDILEECRTVPFSSKVSVDRESIYEIIDEIRLNLPNEIRQAQRIVSDGEKIINDAKSRATNILRDAEEQGERLLHENEIMRRANEQASRIVDDGKQAVKLMHVNAREYADEILEKTETILRKTINNMQEQSRSVEEFLEETVDVIYNNRQELRTLQPRKPE